MVKTINSLQTKLTASFIILILVISGLTFFVNYSQTKKALRETLGDELKALASVIATQIDGDVLATLKPGDETTPEFIRIRDQLKTIQESHPDIKYIYTQRKNDGGTEFIVDADYGNPDDPGGAIGEAYEPTGALLEGFVYPVAEKEFYVDEWGSLMSGYAPIKNTNGEIVAIVGVDMLSTKVLEKEEFIGNTIYVIIALSILLAGTIVMIFSKTIIKDINKLNGIAQKISTGDVNVVQDVKRNDEIGDLAESFSRMVTSLKIMMMDKPDQNAEANIAPENAKGKKKKSELK